MAASLQLEQLNNGADNYCQLKWAFHPMQCTQRKERNGTDVRT